MNPFSLLPLKNDYSAPEFLPIGGPRLVRQTSSTHGRDGYITVDREAIAQNQNRLENKLKTAVDQFSFYDFYDADTDTLLITYGVTSRAAKTALADLKEGGTPIAHLVLKTLWPVPKNLIRDIAGRFSKIVVIEMNMGQYVREIQRVVGDKPVEFFGLMDGNLITPTCIKEVLSHDQPAQ